MENYKITADGRLLKEDAECERVPEENSITPSSASSASLWPKAGRSLDMFVSARPEALILLVPPVYRTAVPHVAFEALLSRTA
jgi:hypothetical protein